MSSHWLYIELCDAVDRLIICDPCRNRLLSDSPRTDKIDAGKLSFLLQAGHRNSQGFSSVNGRLVIREPLGERIYVYKILVFFYNNLYTILYFYTSFEDKMRADQ